MKVDKKIHTLRGEKGLSQLDLAQELDVSRQTISRWENGMAKPTMENLIALGKLFGVSVADLLNEDSGLPSQEEVTGGGQPKQPDVRKHGADKKRVAALVCVIALAAAAIIFMLAARPKQEVRPMEELRTDSWSTSGTGSFSVGW